ncbi:transposase [Parasedimentitalea marina]|uniref:Transposase n=1 Tax=Parasedimentitalea marina TaxID=2483033 RepID=A0A3T0N1I3_9RHOB|nr:phage tail protein [Parasedimentitalea marina]AZV77884.1 transposase [Parasedimentitalea marina]
MTQTLLTDIGVSLINAAAGSGTQVAITEVAIGDANGASYDPGHGQIGLRNERTRVAITKRHIVDSNAWRITAEFAPGDPVFDAREMGFFDSEGNLIFLWAGSDFQPFTVGVVTHIAEHILSFSQIAEGLVIIDAPDDALFDLTVATAYSHATLHLEQFNQSELLRALTGSY